MLTRIPNSFWYRMLNFPLPVLRQFSHCILKTSAIQDLFPLRSHAMPCHAHWYSALIRKTKERTPENAQESPKTQSNAAKKTEWMIMQRMKTTQKESVPFDYSMTKEKNLYVPHIEMELAR